MTTSLVERLRQRGVLRVGYFEDSLPYAFFNARGELVGFDVEMALQLGPRSRRRASNSCRSTAQVLDDGLDPAVCDVVMSGAVGHRGARAAACSSPRRTSTRRSRSSCRTIGRRSSASGVSVRAMGRLRLGVPRAPYFMRRIREELPDVEIVPIDGMEDMFDAAHSRRSTRSSPPPSAARPTRCCTRSTRSWSRSRGRSRCRWPTSSPAAIATWRRWSTPGSS